MGHQGSRGALAADIRGEAALVKSPGLSSADRRGRGNRRSHRRRGRLVVGFGFVDIEKGTTMDTTTADADGDVDADESAKATADKGELGPGVDDADGPLGGSAW